MAAAGAVAAALLVPVVWAVPAGAVSFSNNLGVTVADASASAVGVGSPYPSTLTVSGASGVISKVTLTLTGLTHGSTGDLDVLLASPSGQRLLALSDTGGTNPTSAVTVTLDDAASSAAPQTSSLTSGTYRPTNHDTGDTFPAPGPGTSYSSPAPVGTATFASTFNGLSPNGSWGLYLIDDTVGSTASITGWSLDITTSVVIASTTTTVTSSKNPSLVGDLVTFTATVTSGGNPVTTGAVTFKDGANPLASFVNLNASGQATVTTSGLAEGNRVISATYSGAPGFGAGSGVLTQVVDRGTSVIDATFCNNGGFGLTDATLSPGIEAASVYPSRVFVSGLSGSLSDIAVSVKGLTHGAPDDVDLLLVGPGGQKMVVFSDVGSGGTVTGVDLTLSDSAASALPQTGTLSSGAFKPGDVGTSDLFPSPAPAGPYAEAAPAGSATLNGTFGGVTPNGTWSLYAVDDTSGASGSISGWCVTVAAPGQSSTTTLTSSQNPSETGADVTFTAQVTASGSPVTDGTVTFSAGTTVLEADVPVDADGKASVTRSGLPEGISFVLAAFNGTADVGKSTGSLAQTVLTPTTVTGTTFCNNGGLVFSSVNAVPSVYPSQVEVTGQTGTISGLTVTLTGLTHDATNHLDLLLVGPGNQRLVVMSDVGGANAVSGITLTLDDAAANSLPQTSALTSGTFRPTGYDTGDGFPSPAPSGPWGQAAPAGAATLVGTFGGIDPNGLWSLFAVDDTSGSGGSLAGWCITLPTPPPAEPPTVTVPDGLIVATTDVSGTAVAYTASAEDATGAVAVACAPASGSTFPLGTTQVTCSATNAAGTTTRSFGVSVTAWRLVASPATSTADVGTTAAVTITAERDDGTGWVVDPEGLPVSFTVDGVGTVTPVGNACESVPTPCTVSVTSGAVGVTEVSASAVVGTGGYQAFLSSGTAAVTWVPLDTTPPVITPTVTGTLGSNGWYSSAVTVSWTVTDPESAISDSIGCGPTVITVDTTGTAFTCSASSKGGAASSAVTVKVDLTAPTLSPSVGAQTLPLGTAITPGATDGTSGVASSSCTPSVVTTIGTNQPWSCTATDNAGNQRTASGTFTAGMGFGAFLSPLPKSSLARSTSAIPVKFTLTTTAGQLTGSAAQALVTGNQLRVVLTGPNGASTTLASTTSCTFVTTTSQFQCNLKTPKLSPSQVGTRNAYTISVQQRRAGSTSDADFFAIPGATETVFFK